MKIVPRPRKGERADRCKTWLLVWELPHAKGERLKPITETFHGTKGAAEDRWNERQAEITSGRFTAPVKKTLGTYLDEWLPRACGDLRPTTAASYGQMVRTHLAPAPIAKVPLSDVSADAVQRWVDGMRAGSGPEGHEVGARTAAYARTVLRIALQDAVRLGLIRDNPVDRTRPPKQAPRHVEAFTVEDAARLFDRASSTRLRPLLEVAFYTGLRRGELLALRWEDVDLDAALIVVRRSRVQVGGSRRGQEQDPKTEAGVRTVALPSPAVAALRAQHSRRAADEEAAGPAYEDRDYVFATALGGPLGPNDVSRDFRRLRDCAPCPACSRPTSPEKTEPRPGHPLPYHCRRCGRRWEGGGLPRLPFHALRHSAASLLIAAGVPAEVGAKRLGHKRIATFVDTYGHLMQAANREAAAALDAFLVRHGPAAPERVTGNVTGTPQNMADGAVRDRPPARRKPLQHNTERH